MLAIEIFVGRQERIVHPVADVGVDLASSEHRLHRHFCPASVARRGLLEVGFETRRKRVGEPL